MKAVVAVFNQEKALVGAFSVITNLRMELFEAQLGAVMLLAPDHLVTTRAGDGAWSHQIDGGHCRCATRFQPAKLAESRSFYFPSWHEV